MRLSRLSKSGIDYVDYSWGIFSGCRNWDGRCNVSDACWARSIVRRFPKHYPNGFLPTFYFNAIHSPKSLKKPAIISVGWVGDIIGYGLDSRNLVFRTIEECPQHRFLFLTKNPERLYEWEPFPVNAWVGVSVTDTNKFIEATKYLAPVNARIKFLSFEPLLDWIYLLPELLKKVLSQTKISWVIIGNQTNPLKRAHPDWVKVITDVAAGIGIPIFHKENLRQMKLGTTSVILSDGDFEDLYGVTFRQQMPEVKCSS